MVRCDVNPQAAERRPLEKLLDANGMTWRKPPARQHWAEETGDLSQEVARPKAAGSPTGGRREIIYDVEGTAAQIEATLASLAAQPDVFLSFSVNPPQGELRPTRLEFEQRTQVSGPQAGRGAVGQLDVRRTTTGPTASWGGWFSECRTLLERKRQAGDQARQRVLFVLHVAGGDHSPAAKARAESGADAAKPAEPADRPVSAPATHK